MIKLQANTGSGSIKSGNVKFSPAKYNTNKIISGWEYWMVCLLSYFNVVWLALLRYKYPWRVLSVAAKVVNETKQYKITHPKIAKRENKYYMHLNSPGWPSKAFNRYINHSLNLYSTRPETSLFVLIFAITNKCGFQCDHCFEWNNLNRKDSLSASDLVKIIRRFHRLGVSQVQFSGGEPLNRLDDILFILDAFPEGIDFWMYSNGYNLTADKTARLKKHGLTGIIISLDNHESEKHDQFRGIAGSYQRSLQSARNVIDSRLLLAFSCCATNEFVSMKNLMDYAKICRDAGASFIQFLEPEAVGHFWQKNVTLKKENKELIEKVFYLLNFDLSYTDYPIVCYPGLTNRLNGCPSGIHFIYVDADGYVHSCPFCRKKLFHAKAPDLEKNIRSLKEKGCPQIRFDLRPDNRDEQKIAERISVLTEEPFV